MKNRKRNYLGLMEIVLPMLALLAGLIFMTFSVHEVEQSVMPVPMPQRFVGEYSWDKEAWYPLADYGDLSAFDGDLYLRGHLEEDMNPGSRAYFYRNHIGWELYVDGEPFMADIIVEIEKYGIDIHPSMCRRSWDFWYFKDGFSSDTQLMLRLTNPHSYGNKTAYADFLSTLCFADDSPNVVSANYADSSKLSIVAGIILVIAAVMLLGAALAGLASHVPVGYTLAKFGLLAGFAGGYYIFDTVTLSFFSENNLLNTYGYQICMMYAVYIMGLTAKDLMQGKARKIVSVAMMVSCLINVVLVLSSFVGLTLIFDTLVYWVVSQFVLCPLLIVCTLGSLSEMSKNNRISAVLLVLLFGCIIFDMAWVSQSFGIDGILTKITFFVSFVYIFARSSRNIIVDYMASIRAKKLEKELEESRISVMLSQIQPHFMFNVLGTLRGLCREDPEQAWRGIGDFSNYLRGNMNALTNTKSIPFDSELRHVETYLRLEKMRLGDKLSVVYDIEERDFFIPPLTLQPLVENAVKHGIFFKKAGGTVIIHSGREDDRIILSVQDDGVGFDAAKTHESFEQHNNVGLVNVKNRVEKMLGGQLTVESTPQYGTTVTIEFPLELNEQRGTQTNEHTGGRR